MSIPHATPTRLRGWARAAGAGYLLIIATGLFAEFFVRSRLIVPGDATATAAAITASAPLFRAGIAGELLMLVCDVLVAGALYVIFAGVSRGLAVLAAFFRLVHASIVGGNLLNTWVPLLLLGDASYLASFAPPQRHALASLFLETHAYGYAVGLVFFAAHCLVLAYLVLASGYVPRILGILLVAAAGGYLVDSLGRTLVADYARWEEVLTLVVLVPAFVGELAFCLWLLVKGVEVPEPGSLEPEAAR
jgi:hypothetical protein